MKEMFLHCKSLKQLPGISDLNTTNVTDMSSMFCGCSSITSFPDIYKWDTGNVSDMSYMFKECSSLEYLPDIFKWNTENVSFRINMFESCLSMQFFEDKESGTIIKLNALTLIYNIEKDDEKITIFNNVFVNNNKNNCYLLIDGVKTELCSELS